MHKNNFAPHLYTHQRNSLSKQIQDGFLIFHKEKDQYEQWDKETRVWVPMLDSANGNTYISGGTGEPSNTYDHFTIDTLPDTVTQTEADEDWGSI